MHLTRNVYLAYMLIHWKCMPRQTRSERTDCTLSNEKPLQTTPIHITFKRDYFLNQMLCYRRHASFPIRTTNEGWGNISLINVRSFHRSPVFVH